MKASRLCGLSVVLALGGALVACQPTGSSCPAIVISPGVPFLEKEVERALESLREARGSLPPGELGGARGGLDDAEAALSRLQTYYLPLLEARLRASNAHQLAAGGDLRKAADELDRIEQGLVGLARKGGGEMGREVRDPLDLLEEARLALVESSPEAPARLEALAERLELMLLKGDLVLP
jgi:hypothetical protein